MKFYPIQFYPIFKERIWGGTRLLTELNKPIPSNQIGESWEISAVENDVSIVSNGELKGKSLNKIIQLYPNEILGSEVFENYGFDFPLLFKFLDAKEDLSIQLHPNDELAKKRHNSLGKTEMWYVIHADENARLIVGFKNNTSKEKYLAHLKAKNLTSLLLEHPVAKGDVFFIETGTIHAIGAGTVIAEIQQTSDNTYRVYDWDRVDAFGKQRELHTELALDAIDFNAVTTKVEYLQKDNNFNKLVHCPYFKTNLIFLKGNLNWQSKNIKSFTVLMCTDGAFQLKSSYFNVSYKKGDTLLIPAAISDFQILGIATILEIYL